MTNHDPDVLSEEEAARVWGRAAELQAEAAGRIPGPTVDPEDQEPPASGYQLALVRSAALEAGIEDQFVTAALADVRVERLVASEEKGHPLARRFLKHPPNTITVRKVVEGTPREVLSAMEAVLPGEPFRLTLTDQRGDPLDGGLLVFTLPGTRSHSERGFAFEAADAGLKQVFVSLRPVEDQTGFCEITARSPVTSQNLGLGIGVVFATLGGGAGFGGIGALGFALGLGPVGAIGGLLFGAGLGVKGFRALYHNSMRKAEKALEGLVGAVAVRAKGVWRG